jgi:pyridoxine/pyridoxamine 5'-phosphate oxidase
MTETYRTTKLSEARKELAAARREMDDIKKRPEFFGDRRECASQIEFWGNRVAFLSAVKAED